ncbi:MAG: hypothetical protein H7Z14_02815 [Anaerolineae bacterium]|nr:hypothetical protein [Phycisphaerae bacterium]
MRYSTLALCVLTMFAVGRATLAGSPFDTSGETFQADLYPSQRTAVIRLTQQLAEQIKQTSAEFDKIQIDRDVPGLREALSHEFPQAKIGNEFGGVGFTVAIDAQDQKHGHVIVNAVGKDLAITASAKFVEKPWADDWTLFKNANSSKRYMMASSGEPCASEQEAIDAARDKAVELLFPIVNATMSANASQSSGVIRVSRAWIRDRIKYSVQSNASKVLVADQFVQRFERPYGDVWQASILLDASQSNIQLLNQSYNRTATAQYSNKTKTWSAMAGIALVIGLLYAFINAVTRGYFMWRLRAFAILAAIAGVLVLFGANM